LLPALVDEGGQPRKARSGRADRRIDGWGCIVLRAGGLGWVNGLRNQRLLCRKVSSYPAGERNRPTVNEAPSCNTWRAAERGICYCLLPHRQTVGQFISLCPIRWVQGDHPPAAGVGARSPHKRTPVPHNKHVGGRGNGKGQVGRKREARLAPGGRGFGFIQAGRHCPALRLIRPRLCW